MEERVKLNVKETLITKLATISAFWLVKLKPNQLLRVLTRVSVRKGEATYAQAQHLRNAINSVSPRCAGNGCLQRSVAMMLLARFYSLPLVWRTGFRVNPFIAHAWVEFDNQPVGEKLDLSKFMISLQTGGIRD
ncbi:lasso peptide biosynthesis B2 protein [Arcanobacterium phocisimile]